jgi:hypothetical protein
LEYLHELSGVVEGCSCTEKALPYLLTEDEDGEQKCFCYDPPQMSQATELLFSIPAITFDTLNVSQR